MPAAGFEGEPAAVEAELAAAAGSEMLLAAVAAAEQVGDGWLCGGAGTGGAGTAAGEWLSAAGSPPASADGSAAAVGSANVAGSAYMSLYKNKEKTENKS